jgi:dihydroorotase
MPLLCHGEHNKPHIDVFDREQAFIEQILAPLQQQLPALKVVLEHLTTSYGVDYIIGASDNTAATITAHHLWLNRNDMLGNGIRPHYYCMPILKRAHDQRALITAATSGNPRFFMGTDSAPHRQQDKLQACGCAGVYTAHASIELYCQIFEKHQSLDKLENFCSSFGAKFYNLKKNTAKIKLANKPWDVPEQYPLQSTNEPVIPFMAGETLTWQIVS